MKSFSAAGRDLKERGVHGLTSRYGRVPFPVDWLNRVAFVAIFRPSRPTSWQFRTILKICNVGYEIKRNFSKCHPEACSFFRNCIMQARILYTSLYIIQLMRINWGYSHAVADISSVTWNECIMIICIICLDPLNFMPPPPPPPQKQGKKSLERVRKGLVCFLVLVLAFQSRSSIPTSPCREVRTIFCLLSGLSAPTLKMLTGA